MIRAFEGGSPDEALDKAKKALGENVTIIHSFCEKKGFLGIFSKPKWYIVAAEGPGNTVNQNTTTEKRKIIQQTYKAKPLSNPVFQALDKFKAIIGDIEEKARVKKIMDDNPLLYEEYLFLTRNLVSEIHAQKIIRVLKENLNSQELRNPLTIRAAVREILKKNIRCADGIKFYPSKSTKVIFVGPTGDGKTTTIGKLMGIYSIKYKKNTAIIAADYYKAGAVAQIQSYANEISVPIRIVNKVEKLSSALKEFANYDLVLVDTTGRSPRDDPRIEEIAQIINIIQPDEVYLVINPFKRTETLKTSIQKYMKLPKIDKVVLTKLDEDTRYGAILDVLSFTKKEVSFITTGQEIPSDIEIADSERLADLVIGLDKVGKN